LYREAVADSAAALPSGRKRRPPEGSRGREPLACCRQKPRLHVRL